MTKQEFLAMSLPYDLKTQYFDAERESNHICKIGILWDNGEITISDGEYEYDLLLNDVLPILRPLSDLTKEIEHNGERFVPLKIINHFTQDGNRSFEYIFSKENIEIEDFPFWVINLLLEWHFDLADLISKGEAIDVNTLEINPYN